MSLPAVHASPNAAPQTPELRRRVARGLVIGVAAAFVMAFTGAMGTNDAPFSERLAFWAVVILSGSFLGLGFSVIIRDWWGGLARHRWAEAMVVALAVSLPHTFLVVVASALVFGVGAITWGLIVSFWSIVVVLTLVLTAINYLAAQGATALPETSLAAAPLPALESAPAPASNGEPAAVQEVPSLPAIPSLIAEKLPAHLKHADLIAIEAEDHYLRIHTNTGSDLVLMRMLDACALLPEAAGTRVHRSWCAARGAVEALVRHESRAELSLQGGITVPVSRAMQASLRKQGWG